MSFIQKLISLIYVLNIYLSHASRHSFSVPEPADVSTVLCSPPTGADALGQQFLAFLAAVTMIPWEFIAWRSEMELRPWCGAGGWLWIHMKLRWPSAYLLLCGLVPNRYGSVAHAEVGDPCPRWSTSVCYPTYENRPSLVGDASLGRDWREHQGRSGGKGWGQALMALKHWKAVWAVFKRQHLEPDCSLQI